MTQSVPMLSMLGMIFTFLVSVGVPVALLIILRKKLKANIWVFFVGCGIFILFAMVLEQLMHSFVLTRWPNIPNTTWLYAVYGGLAAGVFEEVGRWVAMRFIMSKRLTKENSLMYGAGHGGIEAILIAASAAVSNFAASVMVNNGTAAAAGMAEDTITQLCNYPSVLFYMSGIERLSAMTLHICLSYIVYRAVKEKKLSYLLLAIGIHFFIDAGTILISSSLSVYVLEAAVLVAVVILLYYTVKAYKSEKSADESAE